MTKLREVMRFLAKMMFMAVAMITMPVGKEIIMRLSMNMMLLNVAMIIYDDNNDDDGCCDEHLI